MRSGLRSATLTAEENSRPCLKRVGWRKVISEREKAESVEEVCGSLPEAGECRGPEDVGRLYLDEDTGIWYECLFDRWAGSYTWTILPPSG